MLHDGQRMHCRRSQADFHKACLNWHNRPHIAIDEGDQAIGYLVSAKDRKRVTELVAMSAEAATDMIAAWAPETGRSDTVFDLWPNNVDLPSIGGEIRGGMSHYKQRQTGGFWIGLRSSTLF